MCIVREIHEIAAFVAVKPPFRSTHWVQNQSAIAFGASTHPLLNHGISASRMRTQCTWHSSLATPFTWFLGESYSTKQFFCPLERRVVVTVRTQGIRFSVGTREREEHQLKVVKRASDLLVQLQNTCNLPYINTNCSGRKDDTTVTTMSYTDASYHSVQLVDHKISTTKLQN